MHLPYVVVVSYVLFLCCCFYGTKFITQNKDKISMKLEWTYTVLKYIYNKNNDWHRRVF